MNLLKKNTKNLIFSSLFLFSSNTVQAETPALDMGMAIIVQSAFNREIDKACLKTFLAEQLPNHMMPKRIKIAFVGVGHRFKRS